MTSPLCGLGAWCGGGEAQSGVQRYDSLVHVNVTVAALDGHRVTVNGAVREPGVVLPTPAARLADLILLAGGTVQNLVNNQMVDGADLRSSTLLRDGSELPIDFQKALAGDPNHNVYMRAGDQVNIPRSVDSP